MYLICWHIFITSQPDLEENICLILFRFDSLCQSVKWIASQWDLNPAPTDCYFVPTFFGKYKAFLENLWLFLFFGVRWPNFNWIGYRSFLDSLINSVLIAATDRNRIESAMSEYMDMFFNEHLADNYVELCTWKYHFQK